jgi:predicted thioredoxin/glutaredoxin
LHKENKDGLNVLSYAKRDGVLEKVRSIEAEYSALYADGYTSSTIKSVPTAI